MGGNYFQFNRILQLKLTLDNRRPNSFSGNRSKKTSSALFWQFLVMFVIGLLLLAITTRVSDSFTLFFLAHTILMVTISMLIISEYSTILLDTSENTILQPLPINSSTLSLARNAHIFVHLMFSALSLMAPTIVQIGLRYGIGSMVVFIFTLILNVVFTLFLSNIMYLGIMNFVKGDKLKNLLMYFQVVIAVFFMAVYQLSFNLFDRVDFANMIIRIEWYIYLLPSTYFAGFTELFSSLNFATDLIALSFVALILPPMGLFVIGKYLSPIFNRKLADLEQGEKANPHNNTQKKPHTLAHFMSKMFAYRKQERSAFVMVWRLIGRERLFLQTILPAFAYILLFMVFPFFKDFDGFSALAESSKYFTILYAFGFLSASIPSALSVGNNKGIGWLLRSLPVESPHQFFMGAMKSVLVRFVFPFYILASVAVVLIWGLNVIVDIAVASLVLYLVACVVFLISPTIHPFSSDKKRNSSAETFIIFIFVTATTVGLGYLHYFGSQTSAYFPFGLMAIYVVSIYFIQKVIFRRVITWKAIDSANSH